MKKIIFTLIAFCFSFAVTAQITITADNMAPVGTTIVQATDTMPGATVVPGTPGGNKVWDFSSLTEDFYDTLYTVSPSQTPYESEFPDANYVFQSNSDGDTLYNFNTLNDDSLASLGFAGYSSQIEDEVTVHLVPDEMLIDFPMQYGNHRDENFYYQFVIQSPVPSFDSLKWKHSETKSVDVDAWGSVTLPSGTYNALRTKEVRYTIDSTWVLFFGSWTFFSETLDTTITYNWYSDEVDPGFTLVSMDYDLNTAGNVSFLLGTLTGIENKEAAKVRLFPNPVSDNLKVTLPRPVSGEFFIYNSSGQRVKKETLNGSLLLETDVSTLPAGTYFVVITDRENASAKYTSGFIKK